MIHPRVECSDRNRNALPAAWSVAINIIAPCYYLYKIYNFKMELSWSLHRLDLHQRSTGSFLNLTRMRTHFWIRLKARARHSSFVIQKKKIWGIFGQVGFKKSSSLGRCPRTFSIVVKNEQGIISLHLRKKLVNARPQSQDTSLRWRVVSKFTCSEVGSEARLFKYKSISINSTQRIQGGEVKTGSKNICSVTNSQALVEAWHEKQWIHFVSWATKFMASIKISIWCNAQVARRKQNNRRMFERGNCYRALEQWINASTCHSEYWTPIHLNYLQRTKFTNICCFFTLGDLLPFVEKAEFLFAFTSNYGPPCR